MYKRFKLEKNQTTVKPSKSKMGHLWEVSIGIATESLSTSYRQGYLQHEGFYKHRTRRWGRTRRQASGSWSCSIVVIGASFCANSTVPMGAEGITTLYTSVFQTHFTNRYFDVNYTDVCCVEERKHLNRWLTLSWFCGGHHKLSSLPS